MILNQLVQNNLQNYAVFVSRSYGGIRMGQERFQCYAESVKAAFLSHNIHLKDRNVQKNPVRQSSIQHQQQRTQPNQLTNATSQSYGQNTDTDATINHTKAEKHPPPNQMPLQTAPKRYFNYNNQRHGAVRPNQRRSSRGRQPVRGARQPSTQYSARGGYTGYNEYGRLGQLFPKTFGEIGASQQMQKNPFGFQYVQEERENSVD